MLVETIEKDGELMLRIEPELRELLAIEPGTKLEVSTDGERVILTRPGSIHSEKKSRLREAMEEVNNQYGEALRNLAK